MIKILFPLSGLAVLASLLMPPLSGAEPGGTCVARWKDDRKAAFMMMFDDCCPTDVTNVYPGLQKHRMTGTFYIVGNKPERKVRLAFWEKEAPASPFVVYGNHTMNHRAFVDVADAEKEIVGCSDLVMRLMPGKNPRLISYATPGGVKNAISQDQINTILVRHQLILRPPFNGHGAAVHFKTAGDILRAVDKAIGGGSREYVIFHGVGGDWLSFDGGEFVSLLDGLDARRADLWITDPVSVHKYEAERDAATVRVTKADGHGMDLELESRTDPALYDEPLTLVTTVDPSWKQSRVSQGGRAAILVPVAGGAVRYDALPGGGPIRLEAN